MATYKINFRTAVDLSDFTNVACDATLVTRDGDQALRLTESGSVGQGLLTVDELGSDIFEADIIVYVQRDYTSENNDRCGGPVIRATGTTSGTVSAYITGSRADTSLQLRRMNGGTSRTAVAAASTGISAATWHWQRFKITDNGVDDRKLSAKAWTGDLVADEPATAQIQVDSTLPLAIGTAGKVGLGSLIQDTTRRTFFRELRIGTNGDAAPTDDFVTGPAVPPTPVFTADGQYSGMWSFGA